MLPANLARITHDALDWSIVSNQIWEVYFKTYFGLTIVTFQIFNIDLTEIKEGTSSWNFNTIVFFNFTKNLHLKENSKQNHLISNTVS